MADSHFNFVWDVEVEEIRQSTVPANTQRHTRWSLNVFKQWAKAREEEFKDFEPENANFTTIPPLNNMTVPELNYWMSKCSSTGG